MRLELLGRNLSHNRELFVLEFSMFIFLAFTRPSANMYQNLLHKQETRKVFVITVLLIALGTPLTFDKIKENVNMNIFAKCKQ